MRQEHGRNPERRDAGVEHDARGNSQGGEDTPPNPVTGAVCQYIQHVRTWRQVQRDGRRHEQEQLRGIEHI